jgi:integrase/recombinase XerD
MKSIEQPVSPSEPSWLPEAQERFRAYLMAEMRAERTVQKYVDYCLFDFGKWIGRAPETWTKKDMQAFKEHLAVDRRPKISENTMVVVISAINQYTANVLERPELRMRAPKRVEKERMPLTEDEVRKILDVAKRKNARDYALVCMAYYGEMRAGEMVDIWVSDLDLDRKKARIRKGKGKNYAMINLSEVAVDALKVYLENVRSTIAPATPEAANLLMLSVNGKPLQRKDVWRIVKKLAFEAGIKKNVFPHLFRHSGITHMAEKGISPYSIQAQSRHKSLDMVMKYIHTSQQIVREDYDRAFNDKPESAKQPEMPSKPAPPEPKQPADDMVLTKIAAMMGELSETKRRRLASMLNTFDHRIELHGG